MSELADEWPYKVETSIPVMDNDRRLAVARWLHDNGGEPSEDWTYYVDNMRLFSKRTLQVAFKDEKRAALFKMFWG